MGNKEKVSFLKSVHGDISRKRINRQLGILNGYLEKFGDKNGSIIYRDMLMESKQKTGEIVKGLLTDAAMYRLKNPRYRSLDTKLNKLISEGKKSSQEFNTILAEINKLGQELTEEFVASYKARDDAN